MLKDKFLKNNTQIFLHSPPPPSRSNFINTLYYKHTITFIIKLNSIKDEQKEKLLKKERNKVMTQKFTTSSRMKETTISNTLQKTLKETKIILWKCTKLSKTSNDWHPKKNWLSKQKKTYLKRKKAVRNHSKILQKHFLYKWNSNSQRIANTGVNTIHIIRNKKSSMDSER